MRGASKKYVLYMHTSPSGKVYIGITCKPLNERFGFEGNGYKLQPYFWRAIQKYGWNNIKHEALLSGLSRSEACEKEREYIAKYRSNESAFGYNQTNGGDTGYNLSSESVAVLSEKSKRHWEEMSPEEREGIIQRKKEFAAGLTEEEKKAIYTKVVKTKMERYTPEERAEQYRRAAETRKATREAKGGATREEREAISARMKKYWDEYHRLHPKKEKKLRYRAPKTWVKLSREEVNRRVSEGLKRKWEDPEFRARMQVLASEAGKKSKGHRAYNKGIPMSEETRRKVSESKKGQHWNLSEETKAKMRKPKSEETRRKMSEAKKKMFADMTPEQRVAYAIRKKQEYNNSVRKAI